MIFVLFYGMGEYDIRCATGGDIRNLLASAANYSTGWYQLYRLDQKNRVMILVDWKN